jgi:hypothetical protein
LIYARIVQLVILRDWDFLAACVVLSIKKMMAKGILRAFGLTDEQIAGALP